MRTYKMAVLCLLAVLLLTPFSAKAESYMTNSEHGMTGTTTVRLVIPSAYTVEIPALVSIPYGAASTPMTIGVSSMELGSENSVKIAVNSPRGSMLKSGGDGEIPFILLKNGEAFSSELYSDIGQTQLSVDIAMEAWYQAEAGEYAGAVTFQVSVEEREVTQ